MAERTRLRPGYGWETPFDLYEAIRTRLGFGSLLYYLEQERTGPIHIYIWQPASGYSFGNRLTPEALIRPVAEIADHAVEKWKDQYRKAVSERRRGL